MRNLIVPRLCLLAIAATLASPAGAQTSFPMLGSAFPVTVQRGKTTEVTVFTGGNGGGNLYGAYKALFAGTGVTAEVVPPEKGWPARDPKSFNAVPNVDQVRVRVTVTPEATPGIREFRIGSPHFGISSVGQLVISDEPQITEVEPNNDLEHAQAVTLPCVVNGRLQQGEDVDCYRFKVAAGQEVTFTGLCARLEDKIHDLQEHADPLIVVRDSTGKELARNDDYYRADPLVHYRFEKAGEYNLLIRDIQYHGNPHWVYSLTMTTRPYVLSVTPCAVQPGKTVTLRLGGFNLGDVQTARLSVPTDAPSGIWTTQLKLPNGLSNPVSLLVSDAPQTVVESPARANRAVTASLAGEKNTPPLPRLGLPGGVNSCLTTDSEIDRYPFTAKKGTLLAFEVMARRLNSQMDSAITIRNARGQTLAENDDADGNTKDSRIDAWTAPEDGAYTMEVRDLTGHSGENYFYNLTAQLLHPDFRLRCDTDRAMIAPGNRTTWYVMVERRHGFAGPVTINVTGLPAGVTASALTIPAGINTGTLFLTAGMDAKIDTSLAQVTGTAQLLTAEGKPAMVTHVAQPMTEIYMPGGGRGLLPVETQGVSVTEPNDLEVAVSTQQVNLTPGASVKIEVTLKRREDYKKPVTLDIRVQHLGQIFADPLPPGVTIDDGASKTLLGEGETKGYITLKANPDAKEIQNIPIAILANASINFVMKVWYAAPPIQLTVLPPAQK